MVEAIATLRNRQCRLAAHPRGTIEESNVAFVDSGVPVLGEDEVLLATRYVSVDPALRLYMDPDSFLARTPGRQSVLMKSGDVMRGWVVGEVVASRSDAFPIGSFARDLAGTAGVQAYCLVPAAGLVPVDPALAPLSAYLGVLGMPGVTAYAGIVEIGRPRHGETVVVSGAAGAVGSLAGQIARLQGCRVIGIAGGPDRCAHVERALGFDACIDHKAGDLEDALERACPSGMNIYFDNVGGEVLDACLTRLAPHARIVGCGFISGYHGTIAPLRNYMNLLSRQVRWECFSYFDLARDPERCAAIVARLATWLGEGAIRHHEQIFDGIESFVPAMKEIYGGRSKGKVLLRLAPGSAAP